MRIPHGFRAVVMAAIPILIFGAGCVQRDVRGDVVTYRYHPGIGIMILAGGIGAVPLCWRIYKKYEDFGGVWP
jgi:hypothetical protein